MTGLFDHYDLDAWKVEPPALPGGLYGLLEEVFGRYPTRTALETADGEAWTYAEVHAVVRQCRERLTVRGVGPADRVLACVQKSPANVFLYLACLSLGAVYVPVNPAYTPAELRALVKDCGPRLVVCDPSRTDYLSGSLRDLDYSPPVAMLPPDGMVDMPRGPGRSPRRAHPPAGGDPAVILYTSGTTGRPRGAVLSHRAVAANVLALSRVWDLRPDDVLLHSLPLFHTHGLLVALQCAMASGASTLLLPSFDPVLAIRFFDRATVFMAVPTYYTRLLEQPALDRRAVAGMRLFTSGSAPLLPRVWDRFRQRTGRRIVERYGMTEVGIITSNPCDGRQVAGSVGYPLEGVEIEVRNDSGRPVGGDGAGELWVRSAGAFTGYLNDEEGAAGVVDPGGWVATGDMAVVAPDGRVSLEGRSKDLIITGGLNVHPLQVEVVLDDLAGVAESAVFGVPHPDLGEAVVAAVVWDGGDPPSARLLREALATRLAGYRIPKRILWAQSLPRNAMGKVQKALLQARHRELFS